MKKIILLIASILVITNLNAQTFRYSQSIFPSATKTADVVYGTADFLNSPYVDESATTSGNLIMDIYQPTGDTRTDRPAIIFAHGGGFYDGSKNVDDMEAFCDSFARKGYVTATIDYRQGVQVSSNGDLHYVRAAYRGIQDGRAAIRFLRANAVTYGIDPTKIYWGGNSAGSVIGLNTIYMDADEVPSETAASSYTENFIPYNAPDLGNLDVGGNLAENGEPDAVMSCWGGIGDPNQVEPANNQPVFLVHGTADDIVPFNSGPPFNLSGVSDIYGSNAINTELESDGIPAHTKYFVDGEGHEFYGVTNGDWTNGTGGNEYWDTIVVKATKFYHDQFKPTADFTFLTTGVTVDFTDASTDAVSYIWDFGDSQTSTVQNPSHTYAVPGFYDVKLYIENSQANWDTIVKKVNPGAVPMSGTYSVGTGDNFNTITDAFNSLYFNGAGGAITFEMTANYNPATESYPVYIPKYTGASDVNTVTLKPATATTHSLISNAVSIISLIDASYIIIDGSNNGTDSRDLTLSCTSISAETAALVLYTDMASGNNITIKNCIIKGGTKEFESAGIVNDNFSNVTISNNLISKARTGIYSTGDDVVITNNIIGSENVNEYLHLGIGIENCSNITIQQNTIYNLIDNQDYDPIRGIGVNVCGGAIDISKNIIKNLIHTGSETVKGIALNELTATEIKVVNNHISGLASDSYTDKITAGIAINCPAITNGLKINYNSINLSENTTYGAGTGDDNTAVAGIAISAGTGIIMKNNIISNTLGERDGSTMSTTGVAMLLDYSTTPFKTNGIKNNLYFSDGNNDYNFLAATQSGVVNLADWETWSGETGGYFADPLFVGDNDLNLQKCSNAIAHAIPLAGVFDDINGDSRHASIPSIGAYEYEMIQASGLSQMFPVKGAGYVYLSWIQGTGCKRAVFMKEGDYISEPPVPQNGVTYVANNEFGLGDEIGSTGWFCVDNSDVGNNSAESTVVNGQTYTVMVCDYFGDDGNEIYLTETSTNNPILVTGDNSGNVDELNNLMSIYPNPTNNIVTIQILDNSIQIKNIEITDITGRVVNFHMPSVKQKNNFNINLEKQPVGIYFIKVETNTGIITNKIIKR